MLSRSPGAGDKPSESAIAYDQAVIAEIDFAGLEDFGTDEQRQAVRSLEEEIESVLSLPAGLDGDEFGEGAFSACYGDYTVWSR